MAQNRKITDLEKVSPKDGYNFLVATSDNNYRVTFPDLASAVNTNLNLDGLSGHLQGQIDNIDDSGLLDQLNDISGHFEQSINNINISKGGISSSFTFFSSIINNNGAEISTYYDTPTPNTHLSGSYVESSSDLRVSLRWDGPDNDYMGTGYINNIEIPKSNIQELGLGTRRFEGYIDNFNAQDSTQLTGVVNGVTGFVDLVTIGSGPSASNISIDTINNATPKNGEELGASALKLGDTINIFVDYQSSLFDNNLTSPKEIQIDDYGISNGIPFSIYSFIDIGDGLKRATIPITVSNRVGEQGVRLRAVNNMGSTGIYQSSDADFASENRLLDQNYPSISISTLPSYNGRTDGLRESESTTFANSILNFDSISDTIQYSALTVNNASFSVSNSNTFEPSKTVSYVDGVYADQDNLNIRVVRTSNGATDSEDLSIKIANGPVIHSALIVTPAVSSLSNYVVGLSELKDGDVVNIKAIIDTQGESSSSIQLKVFDDGISNGSQTTFTDYPSISISSLTRSYVYNLTSGDGNNYTVEGDAYGDDPTIYVVAGDTLTFNNNTGGHLLAVKDSSGVVLASENETVLSFTPSSAGTYTYQCTVTGHENMNGQIIVIDRTSDLHEYTIPTVVTSSRNGDLNIELQARNQYSTVSDPKTSTNIATVNNSGPVVTISSVLYPSDQQAIKSGETATISNSASNFDTIVYSDPSNQNQLTISNASSFEASKTVTYNSGDYNISTNNLEVLATKNSNGLTASSSTVVKIANTPLNLNISDLAPSLTSSSAGISDNFNLNSSQIMLSTPSLSTDSSQNPPSELTHDQQGTGLNSNNFTIKVKDVDQKGTFSWIVSAFNLANIETSTITTNPNYLISGFSEREILASPNSLAGGLAFIGTTVSNPNNVSFENVSEGGPGPNGGTIYSFLQLTEGTQLDFSFNHDNKFSVCDANGIVDNNGDHVFNLDSLSRAANADINNPAKYIIKED